MERAVVKLKLEVRAFDEAPFASYLEQCERDEIGFETMYSVGETETQRRMLYELNKECSRDIPARGQFYTYEEYCEARFDRPEYNPHATMLALDRGEWIGMSATSDWRSKGFMFNEMTGVRASYRGRGIAIAMKLLGIRFARSAGVDAIYTLHDFENDSAIMMNRRLGYVDAEWDSLV